MIELFTTIDENWLPYACMMVGSVQSKTTCSVRCWVLHENIRPRLVGRVTDWAQRRGIDFRFLDLKTLRLTLPVNPKYSGAALWGRYLAGAVLPDCVQRCVYLDVDVMAERPIDELMSMDLGDKPIGAVLCPAPHAAHKLGLAKTEYLNNGVLVMNPRHVDGHSLVWEMDATMKAHDLVFGPQCAFSLAARGHVSVLEPKWNVQGEYRATWSRDAHIIHFTGDLKPWHYLSRDPLRDTVRQLIEATPFPEAWHPDRSPIKMVRRALGELKRERQCFLARKG
jgi:lipopolysaccharide biosynthesis glycosyltransferase